MECDVTFRNISAPFHHQRVLWYAWQNSAFTECCSLSNTSKIIAGFLRYYILAYIEIKAMLKWTKYQKMYILNWLQWSRIIANCNSIFTCCIVFPCLIHRKVFVGKNVYILRKNLSGIPWRITCWHKHT